MPTRNSGNIKNSFNPVSDSAVTGKFNSTADKAKMYFLV
jgi:hypothetical protein